MINANPAIIDFLKSKKQVPTRMKNGDYGPGFKKFLDTCRTHGFDVYEHFDAGITYKDIRIALLNGLEQPKCVCGKPTEYAINTSGGYYAVRCGMACRSNDPLFTNKMSSSKTELYSDPERKAATEAKKMATTMHNHGVAHPMQNPELAAKKLAACGVKPRPKVGSDGQSGDVLGA